MRRALFVALALLVAACAQIPESTQEKAARKMEPVPGKAVVYIVQGPFPQYAAGIAFDDGGQVTMWPSSFYRWVTTPGTHAITSSEGRFNAYIKLQVEAGKVYFVENWTAGAFGTTTDTGLQLIDDKIGRQLVKDGGML
jgi:hypothetical protein